MTTSRTRRTLCLALAALLVPLSPTGAAAAPTPPAPPAVDRPPAGSTAPARRDDLLGADWQRSTDRVWTTSGDADGFHVLVADASTGYTWRTAATLWEQGFDSDLWIGNACVTASTRKAVVVYAPRLFTNKADLFDRGGFTATVDLDTGAVTKLPIRSSIAYFNPGCGSGETAVLTQDGSEDLGRTRLTKVDAGSSTVGERVELPGQVTSAVPVGDAIVAADGSNLVRVSAGGERSVVARTTGTAFHVHPDADGGVVYLEKLNDEVRVRRAVPSDKPVPATTLATGALKDLGIASGKAGSVVLTGRAKSVSALPPSVVKLDLPRDARPSTEGKVAVVSTDRAEGEWDPSAAEPRKIALKVLGTGKQVDFVVDPSANPSANEASGRAVHPKLAAPGDLAATGLDDPVDQDATCSVRRGDPANQATQPTPQQAEWAADNAVLGTLESGTGAQKMFPPIPLAGGQKVPPQILLGIMAQESNLWQAARFALPGVSANPLIGNYYGLAIYNSDGSDDWDVHWSDADCGYGITQVTDGMRLAGRERDGETALPEAQQRAIALDHKSNIAKGLRLLQEKWNLTRNAGMIVNDGNPRKIENWFFAVWAYNSGFTVSKGDGSPWGLGWLNNPVNPRYPEGRPPFMEHSQADAKNPQWWPYPEKVMGWAAQSISTPTGPGFAPAWWNSAGENGTLNREEVKPPAEKFCTAANQCVPGQKWVPDDPSVLPGPGEDPEKPGPCDHKNPATGKRDLKCWWHDPVTWKPDCDQTCGNWNFTYDNTDAPPPGGTNYPPRCGRDGLPTDALIVDDLVQQPTPLPGEWTPIGRQCVRSWVNHGRFDLAFDNPSAKIDFHQIGGAFDNHFFFAHTRRNDQEGNRGKVTGTWTLDQSMTSWARVLVHLPDHGAHTQQAKYEIDRGNGFFDKHRYLSQGTESNRWVSLGVYQMVGTPKVRLSTTTADGLGEDDIAWDAIAVQPLPAKPKHIVAALGDSYSSGEGAGDYYRETDNNHGTPRWAACRRSKNAWSRKLSLPGTTGTAGSLSDGWDKGVELGFVACSGAQTWNVQGNGVPYSWTEEPRNYEKGEGQFHEMSQLESGVLDENTTLVTLSVGGNDAGFTQAMVDCGLPTDCSLDDTFLPRFKKNVDDVQPEIAELLGLVKTRAPNAKIVVVGYPELLSRTVKCGSSWWYDMTEVRALAALSTYMRDKQAQTVGAAGARVSFADPITAFVGHGGCDPAEWINKLVIGPNGEGDFHAGERTDSLCLWKALGGACLGRETFHPNSSGTSGYAGVVEDKLRQIGYQGS